MKLVKSDIYAVGDAIVVAKKLQEKMHWISLASPANRHVAKLRMIAE